ncbi:antitoxin Xre/MbcA/ParS toxin-binding domain-containing protein [Thiohalomonas denitrificans]|uniref:antitoxin Xre/MbcA/ParS toxin-binding domain-containing protein n=1 Tax=Thiohalomonas denitrificans TaxID=415747 RepID=UPI0026ED1181|nr:antitoxin Xre/MbcA/ParS toxin-binding domain-containing protein [Thiohalomonas denitrificans]
MNDPLFSPEKLSQSVVQAGDLLGLVRAEVARILGFKCESISALYNGRLLLEEGTKAWREAVLFVRFYQLLDERMAGDEARMVNWLRREQEALGSSPFYLIIDEGRLADVVAYLEQQS